MARINANQAEEMSSYNSSWLKLKDDGDTAKVQFFARNEQDLDIFAVHKIKVDGRDRHVNCLRDYDDPKDMCPMCMANLKLEAAVMLAMVDVDTQQVKIWQRGKSFLKTLHSLFNRYQPVDEKVFEIERVGKAGDMKTTYQIYRDERTEPVDMSEYEKPEFIGTVILDLDAQAMNYYLDTGKIPSDEESEAPRRESSRREPRRDDEPAPSRATRRRG